MFLHGTRMLRLTFKSPEKNAQLVGDDYGNYGGYGGFGDDDQQENYSYWRRDEDKNESDGYDTQVALFAEGGFGVALNSGDQLSLIRARCFVVLSKRVN